MRQFPFIQSPILCVMPNIQTATGRRPLCSWTAPLLFLTEESWEFSDQLSAYSGLIFLFSFLKKVNYKLVSLQKLLYWWLGVQCSLSIYFFGISSFAITVFTTLISVDVKHYTSRLSSGVTISPEKRSSSTDTDLGTGEGFSATMEQTSEDDSETSRLFNAGN